MVLRMDTSIPSQTVRPDKTNTQSVLNRMKSWYRGLPDKKRYLEFITALLTIPVLLTVLLSNVNNLQNQKRSAPATVITVQPTPSAYPSPTPETTALSVTPSATPPITATPGPQCNANIPPVTIASPQENDIVSGDPVCLEITGQGGKYCSVVWSYRINGGAWSNYTSDGVCMYGLAPGNKTLDLRVQSVVTGDQTTLTRHFTVDGVLSPTPTPATASATTH